MTRINLIDPRYLTNAHLMAEYRELPRIFTAVKELVSKGVVLASVDAPIKYKLGSGHVKFFYGKCMWLRLRYHTLYAELISRKYHLDPSIYHKVLDGLSDIPEEWFGNYLPTPEDMYLNMARLVNRSNIEEVLGEVGMSTGVFVEQSLTSFFEGCTGVSRVEPLVVDSVEGTKPLQKPTSS